MAGVVYFVPKERSNHQMILELQLKKNGKCILIVSNFIKDFD